MTTRFAAVVACAIAMVLGVPVHADEDVQVAAAAPALVLLPAKTVEDQAFGQGCWAHLFDGVDYKGKRLTLVGPLALEDMRHTGSAWRDWDSLKIGPKAVVTIYIVADFGLPVATFKAGQQVADLTSTTGRFENISSVKVACEP